MPSAGQTLTGCAPKQPAVRQCSTCDQSCEAASYDNKARQSKRSFNLLRIQSAAEEANLGVLQMCMTAAFASDNSGWWSPSSVRKKPPLSLPAPSLSLSLSSSSSTAKGSCQAASPHASAHWVEFSLPVFSSAGHVRCARPPRPPGPPYVRYEALEECERRNVVPLVTASLMYVAIILQGSSSFIAGHMLEVGHRSRAD